MVRSVRDVHVAIAIESDIVRIVQQRRCGACVGGRAGFDGHGLIPDGGGADRNERLN